MLRTTLKWIAGLATLLVLAVVLVVALFSWQAGRRETMTRLEAAPSAGHFVKSSGLDIFVQEAGPPDAPVVLFVHGTGAWSDAWRGPMSALARSGVRAVALDLPPFGFSERPADAAYGKVDQGRRIVGVLNTLGIARAIFVGHSFGAGPTMEAALLAPDRVRAIILVDAALGVAPDGAPSAAPPPLLKGFLGVRPLREGVVATFLTNPMFTRKLLQAFIDDPARATADWVAVYRRPLVVRGTTAAVGDWLPELLVPSVASPSQSAASYRALKVPLFMIWGERDTITPVAQARFLASITPGAQLEVMKQVGHIPQIEDAAGFNRVLLDFVDKANHAP
jgi:pimeloyl-ACP methyl ester carboxylesterase